MPADPAEPRWLNEIEREAWLGLLGVSLLLPAALDSQLQRDSDLSTFDYLVLAMLSEAPDHAIQLKHLARLTNGSLSRLSHTITRLERRGWVRRQTSASDRRATVAILTDAGSEKVVDSAPGHVEAVRRLVFDPLPPEHVASVAAATRAILGELSAQWYATD